MMTADSILATARQLGEKWIGDLVSPTLRTCGEELLAALEVGNEVIDDLKARRDIRAELSLAGLTNAPDRLIDQILNAAKGGTVSIHKFGCSVSPNDLNFCQAHNAPWLDKRLVCEGWEPGEKDHIYANPDPDSFWYSEDPTACQRPGCGYIHTANRESMYDTPCIPKEKTA